VSRPRPLALVTGARRGIGASIAVRLSQDGFDVALTDLARDGAQAVLDAIEANGTKGHLFESDLADVAGHPGLIERVAAWGGPICCLVNNAGIGAPRRGDMLDIGPEAFDLVLGVNLRGTFFLTQAVARHMLATQPPAARSIVTVSSVSADMASIERAEYCTSKAGLSMLTKLFALRLAAAGIGVFEVRPGVIRTPLTAAVAAQYDLRIAEGLVPMARWGEPQDVASAVSALAAGQMNFATGSVLNVDGGLSIQRF
jgi:NAD(P)-dependent dehydrogenase (short-subunit alcohol dehydrogenase family)